MRMLLQGGPDNGRVIDVPLGSTEVCCPVARWRVGHSPLPKNSAVEDAMRLIPVSRYKLRAMIGDVGIFKYVAAEGGALGK
jgi:hypothetical protein